MSQEAAAGRILVGAMMEQAKFVAEGRLEVDPPGWFFVYLDGEYLGKRLVRHFQPSEERGHADLGRVRITVERLDEGQA